MTDHRRRLGDFGERAAMDYLQRRGYKILESNVRCPLGEIDIVARDGDFLVFVEVRTRKGIAFGSPEESITSVKREKLIALAESYLRQHDTTSVPWRIDVVSVELGRNGKITRMDLIVNAIS